MNIKAVNGPVTAVPEPSTWALMLLGFGAIALVAGRARNKLSWWPYPA